MSDVPNGSSDAPREAAKVLGRESLRPPLPKRFYKAASVEDARESDGALAFRVVLDGRALKTPRKRAFGVPSRALAEAIVAEWAAQGAEIDPATMPLTRIANTAIDAVADAMSEVASDIVAFAGSDLLCYRAEGPPELAARQRAHWDPVVRWSEEALGAHFIIGKGVMPVAQPEEALARLGASLQDFDAFQLAALHVLTTLSGSALLALYLALGAGTAEAVWAAAHVDEDYQIELWGRDDEAEARRAYRLEEFRAACRVLASGAA